jgi:predicted DNA-binding protein
MFATTILKLPDDLKARIAIAAEQTGKTPIQTMKEWFKSNPDLFHRRPYDRPGCDS